MCVCHLPHPTATATAYANGDAVSVPTVSHGRERHEAVLRPACLSYRALYTVSPWKEGGEGAMEEEEAEQEVSVAAITAHEAACGVCKRGVQRKFCLFRVCIYVCMCVCVWHHQRTPVFQ